MKIEIWSDIACPHCYIGLRRLQKALAQFADRDKIELEWHSYELDPSLPQKWEGRSFANYYAQKSGLSEDMVNDSLSEVTASAKTEGLYYDFANLVPANTSDALRMVKLAKEKHLATEMEEVLFDAYFVKAKDVSDRNVLVELGVKVGLGEKEIVAMLDSDRYKVAIKKDMEYSENELDLQYIPFYLLNNKQIVQGSIAVEDYLAVLTQAYAEWEANGVSSGKGDVISGQSCSIDGVCS